MPFQYANGTVSDIPPYLAFDVFPQGNGYIYGKLALDGLIEAYCGTTADMQIQPAKWRILALLNQEYKSLSFLRAIYIATNRTDGEEWDTLHNKMIAIDSVAREYSKELLGKEM